MVKPNFCFGAGAGALGSKLKFWSRSWSFQPQSIILELELELLAPNKSLKVELGLQAPVRSIPFTEPPTTECHIYINVNNILSCYVLVLSKYFYVNSTKNNIFILFLIYQSPTTI